MVNKDFHSCTIVKSISYISALFFFILLHLSTIIMMNKYDEYQF